MSTLEATFRKKLVLEMAEIRQILGSVSRVTAFRRLRELPYCSSYSHRGKHYTLEDIPDYDAHGVWVHGTICFSCYGTLQDAAVALVEQSPCGCTASELRTMLRIDVLNAVKRLIDQGRLIRRHVGSEYVYLTPGQSAVQLTARKRDLQPDWECGPKNDLSDHLSAFLSTLSERQRRLYLGFESLKLGRGGDKSIAAWAGVNAKTVARGRRELVDQDICVERVRAAGAGRPPLKKTT